VRTAIMFDFPIPEPDEIAALSDPALLDTRVVA
jgi:hypothetical protein